MSSSGNASSLAVGDSGGGIYNDGTLAATNCTFLGNSAPDGGGGIYNDGTMTVTSSTFSGNATSGSFGSGGGGILNDGTLTVIDSTLSGNHAGIGGGIDADGGTVVLADTIIAGNDAESGPADNDFTGPVTSLGYNLIGNSLGASGFVATDLLDVNPLLGPLQDNGGSTQTMALMAGSPAIDAGGNSLIASGITTDPAAIRAM
jgi:predicted outer membrane repeat protein